MTDRAEDALVLSTDLSELRSHHSGHDAAHQRLHAKTLDEFATKPLGTDVLYVDGVHGNDDNDGKSWGSAKATLLAAYDAISSGVIYLTGNPQIGADPEDGLWIRAGGYGETLSGTDPLWRERKRVDIVGVGGTSHNGNSPESVVALTGGSATDGTRPALWITGVGGPMKFEKLGFTAACAAALGFDSGDVTHGQAGTVTASISFPGCNFISTGSGEGPPVKINSSVFWVWFPRNVFSADQTFAISDDGRACVLIKDFGGDTANAGWLVYFTDPVFNFGGVIQYGAPMDLSIKNASQEGGGGSATVPPIYRVRFYLGGAGRAVSIDGASVYDASSPDGIVVVEGTHDPSRVLVSGVSGQILGEPRVVGPATVITAGLGDGTNPLVHDQIVLGAHGTSRIVGRSDVGKAAFGVRSVKKANLVNWDGVTNWYAGTPTRVQGPLGTPATGALRFATTVGGNCDPYNPAGSGAAMSAGDIIVLGSWIKYDPTEQVGGQPLRWVIPNGKTASRFGVEYRAGNNGGSGWALPPWKADGDWVWCVDWFTLDLAATLQFRCLTTGIGTIDIYGPMLLRFTAGEISESEAAELAESLYEWPSTAPVGHATVLPGQALVAYSPDGTPYKLIPPNGGGAAAWAAV